MADISDSTKNSTSKIAEFIDSAQQEKRNGDKTAVSVFGGRAVTTVLPTDEYVNVNLDTASVEKKIQILNLQ